MSGLSLGRLTPRRLVLAVVLLVLAALITFGYEAWRAATALDQVRSDGTLLTTQLDHGDLTAARATARRLGTTTARAHHETNGPLWAIGAHLPVIGRDIGAVRTSAAVLDAIAEKSLPTLLSLADDVESGSLRPRHGRVDLSAVHRLSPQVSAAAHDVDGPAAAIAKVSSPKLIYPLNTLVAQLQQRVSQATIAIDATADAFRVMPTMLGEHRHRSYLLLVQSPAEIRSTGGLPGSWAVLHAYHGRLTMGEQGDATLFATGHQPVKPTKAEANLYGSRLGVDPRDLNFNPDFPRVAQMAAGLAASKGVHVDGVFAVDPIALTYVLRGTGGVPLTPTVELTSQNATSLLLNTIYRTVQNAATQNSFYSLAARRTFEALVAGQGDQVLAIRGLVVGASQQRVLAWSPIPELRAVIARNKLSGALPLASGTTANVGLYLNDGVAGKMEYYLRYDSVAQSLGCRDGVQRIRLQTTFRSQTPPGIRTFSPFVTGTGAFTPRGDILAQASIYGPWHGHIDKIMVDGRDETVTSGTQDGHEVGLVAIHLRPGQSVHLSTVVTSGKGQTGTIRVSSTPGMQLEEDPATYDGCG